MAIEKLYSQKLSKKTTSSATQQFLDIAEIRDNVITLKNGSLRAILSVSSINYDLKSSDEQEAIIGQYQNFLNSLDFPVQILIVSRKLNMEKYMEFIEGKEKEQTNELLKLQISEYKNFVNQLVSVSNIMDKDFYMVVPFSPIENVEKGFFSKLFKAFGKHDDYIEKQESFQTYKNQLFQRLDHITAGLSGIGLRLAHLETQDLIELLFNAYNPAIFTPNAMVDVENLDIK